MPNYLNYYQIQKYSQSLFCPKVIQIMNKVNKMMIEDGDMDLS